MVTGPAVPRLLIHLGVAAAGMYALAVPPPSIAAVDPMVGVVWAVLLLTGGALSTWGVMSGFVLPHVAGLGLEIVAIVVYCIALWLFAEKQSISVLLLMAAFACGLVERGLRIRSEARR